MCFNQTGEISSLNGGSLKLLDKFTNLGSSVSSTETDINTWLAKAWTPIDRLLEICKSDPTDKMKRRFFQATVVSILQYEGTIWTLTKRTEKTLTPTTQENGEQHWTSPRGSMPQSSSCTVTYHSSRKLAKLDEPDMQNTTGEVGTSSLEMYSGGPLHMDEQRQDDQLDPTIQLLCADTRCGPEDLPEAMNDWVG